MNQVQRISEALDGLDLVVLHDGDRLPVVVHVHAIDGELLETFRGLSLVDALAQAAQWRLAVLAEDAMGEPDEPVPYAPTRTRAEQEDDEARAKVDRLFRSFGGEP